MEEDRICDVDSCGDAAVAALAEQNFCLKHFVARCYEQLDLVDPRGRKAPPEFHNIAKMREFIEECSKQTLDVCLRSGDLTNLERGRLLDILLWAGELFLLLRAPRMAFSDSPNQAACSAVTRAASPA